VAFYAIKRGSMFSQSFIIGITVVFCVSTIHIHLLNVRNMKIYSSMH